MRVVGALHPIRPLDAAKPQRRWRDVHVVQRHGEPAIAQSVVAVWLATANDERDPDRLFVRALGLALLPAFVFIRLDGTLQACAEGWDANEWRDVAEQIATATAWISPTIPVAGDPGPFHGTPALG